MMLRSVMSRGAALVAGRAAAAQAASQQQVARASTGVGWLWQEHHPELPPDEFDKHYLDFFNRTDLDGWMVRKGMTDLQNCDVIPEPKIIEAALRACRRVNDYALAVRFLEAIRLKCGPKAMVDRVYPWLIQEIRPCLTELGISTPEELGYNEPELFHPSVHFWEKHFYREYNMQDAKAWDGGPKYTGFQ